MSSCLPYGPSAEFRAYCFLGYKTTDEGTMISVRPNYTANSRSFDIEFFTQEFPGDTFRLSPVLKSEPSFMMNLHTLPVYLRNSTLTSNTRVPVDSMRFELKVCGYDPLDPYVCKGYITRPEYHAVISNGTLPVITNEFGEYNHYHRCISFLKWPLVILDPDFCEQERNRSQ